MITTPVADIDKGNHSCAKLAFFIVNKALEAEPSANGIEGNCPAVWGLENSRICTGRGKWNSHCAICWVRALQEHAEGAPPRRQ